MLDLEGIRVSDLHIKKNVNACNKIMEQAAGWNASDILRVLL